MKHDTEITAEQIFRGKPAPTCPDATIRTISPTEVMAAFRRRFEAPPDVGIWKRLFHTVFEAPNPFDAKPRRRVRQEAIILGTLAFAAIALATYFNLNAPPR
jgi:hypothetical protein